MSSLPAGWTRAQVGELVTLNPRNDAHDCTLVGFVPMSRLGVDYRSPVSYEPRPWSDIKQGYTHFADGDVLLAKITPCFENGKAGLVRNMPNGLGAGSTEYFVNRPKHGVLDARYLLGFFKTEAFLKEGAVRMTGSVGHKRVPKEYLVEAKIPLAPINEQKRIADKLDAVLARVDACRERLDRIPAILKRFRQSVLAAATSGKLTEEWRTNEALPDVASRFAEIARNGKSRRGVEAFGSSSELSETAWSYPKGWARATAGVLLLKGVLADLKDGNHGANHPRVSDFESEGLPFITAAQVNGFRVDYAGAYKLAGEPLRKIRVGFARPGDVVLTHKGSVGRVACIDRNCVLTPQTTYYRVNPEFIVPEYLMYYLASTPFVDQLDEIKSQTTRDFVPISQQYGLWHLIPSLSEQTEIVRRVESLFAYADRLEARYAAARAQVEKLTSATLAKAFRGELVPQDPNDEPAAALLARLKSKPQAAPKNGQDRRRQQQRKRETA